MEDLYQQLGGMSWFQVRTVLLIGLCQVPIGWSMLQMSFDGVAPEYRCVVPGSAPLDDQGSANFSKAGGDPSSINSTLQTPGVCSINGVGCESYSFGTSMTTVITEWGLLCDKKWVKGVIISIQMVGVLVGTLVAGQVSDTVGRKRVIYSAVACHFVCDVIAAFSVSWAMYATMRFFLGICIGAVLVVALTFQLEFLPMKWRPLLGILPSFSLGVCIFAGIAALLENWSHLHIACACVTILPLIGAIFVTESPRWLAVQGRQKEAMAVIEKISALNKKPVPEDALAVIQSLRPVDKQPGGKTRRYTYISLFMTRKLTIVSFIFFYYWFILAAVYYGISFGIGSLSGNLYLNLFFLGVMEIPVQTTVFFLSNKIGRRWTNNMFLALCSVSLLGCLIFHEASQGQTSGTGINVLSILAKLFVGSAWSAIQVWNTESFPTVIRNLACGFGCLGARFGGIVAPYIFNLEERMTLSYAICCGMLGFGIILGFWVPETMGKLLRDTTEQNNFDESSSDLSTENIEFISTNSNKRQKETEET